MAGYKINIEISMYFYVSIINRRISNFLKDNKNYEVSRNKSYKSCIKVTCRK